MVARVHGQGERGGEPTDSRDELLPIHRLDGTDSGSLLRNTTEAESDANSQGIKLRTDGVVTPRARLP